MRTVRSAAEARNRPRTGLGWALSLVLLFLTVFLLALRVAGAAPAEDTEGGAIDAGADVTTDPRLDDPTAATSPSGQEDDALDDALDGEDPDRWPLEARAALAAALAMDPVEASARLRPAGTRRSWLGRIDVAIAWRRATTLDEVAPTSRHEVWLLGRWRL